MSCFCVECGSVHTAALIMSQKVQHGDAAEWVAMCARREIPPPNATLLMARCIWWRLPPTHQRTAPRPPSQRERDTSWTWGATTAPHPCWPRPDLRFFTHRIIYVARHSCFLVIVQAQWDRRLDRLWGGDAELYSQPDDEYKGYSQLCSTQRGIISSGSISKPIPISSLGFAVCVCSPLPSHTPLDLWVELIAQLHAGCAYTLSRLHNAFQCSLWGFYTVLACILKLIYHGRAAVKTTLHSTARLLSLLPKSLPVSIPHIHLSPPSCTSNPLPQVISIFNYLSETPGLDPLPPSSLPHLIHFKLARNLPMIIQWGEIYSLSDIEWTASALWEGLISTDHRYKCVKAEWVFSLLIVVMRVYELIISLINQFLAYHRYTCVCWYWSVLHVKTLQYRMPRICFE